MDKKKNIFGEAMQILWRLLVVLVLGAVYFYIQLPAINLQNPELYLFVLVLVVTYGMLKIISLGILKDIDEDTILTPLIIHNCKIPVSLCAFIAIVALIGFVVGMPVFRANEYHRLLSVSTGDFATDVEEVSFERIPILDERSAIRLGNRQMGELSDLVGQFEVSEAYTQINFRGRPVRVTYLNYGDLFKWWNNRGRGLPAYITIDMTTQEANVVRLSDLGLAGIKYSPSEWFNRKLQRHIRFHYPTFMFSEATFEIDDEGRPWWICPRMIKRIGLFGGVDIQGAVLVDAITGESSYYEDVPSWCDRVFVSSLIMQQYNFHGTYINGFLNSLFGQQGVTVTTMGYNYIVMEDDVYMYTGVTSVGKDQSNIGFLLSNQRTKETTFYAAPGAIEQSARDSAEGVVQHLRYTTTFPLLLNVSGEPTYFMSMKDASDLVKQYAMVNVGQYQVVATGNTVPECKDNYLRLLAYNGIADQSDLPQISQGGVITELYSAVLYGNTQFYIRLDANPFYYVISLADYEPAAVLKVGDRVSISHVDEAGELRRAYSVEKTR